MSRRQPRRRQRRNPESELDNSEEQQAQATSSGAAIREALDRQNEEQFLERLRDINFRGDDADELLDELGIEFSGVYAIANEDEDDYRRHMWLDRNKSERIRASGNPGRLCTGAFYQLATGENHVEGGRERALTQREKRQIREAMEAKTALHSLGKGGEGLSAVSEVTAVTEHRRQTEPDDSGSSGLLSRVFS